MKQSELVFPCQWDKEILKKIASLKHDKGIVVKDMYGSLPMGPIGHGRDIRMAPKTSKKMAVDYKKTANALGFRFFYTFNTPFSFSSKSESEKLEIDNFLKWVIEEFKTDALIVASFELMKYIREKYPSVRIHISTVAGVKTIEELDRHMEIAPARVILHHDSNRNFEDTKKIVSYCKERNIEVEIMTTESCLRRCPVRAEHYQSVGEGKPDAKFHVFCNSRKLAKPMEFLKANLIRPEDLRFYEDMGINIFKITGRSKDPIWMPEVVEAYLQRRYEGNLLRLTGIDPRLDAESWIYINNKALDGFLNGFPQTQKPEDENKYCEGWITKLYKSGDFKVMDGDQSYKAENEQLISIGRSKKITEIYGDPSNYEDVKEMLRKLIENEEN
jgi:collagenase-like PrtC family protease